MTILGLLEAKAIIFLSFTLTCNEVIASSSSNFHGFGARRILNEDSSRTPFDITTFGADINDDGTKNFEAFGKAWSAACKNPSPAKVVIPQGSFVVGPVIFTGPCTGPEPIIFEVLGTVKATTDLTQYETPEWINFQNINGLIITGGGAFDGQGNEAWMANDCKQNSQCQPLPSSLKFSKVNNAIIHGISSLNSKQFHIHVFGCNNWTAYDINITAPDESPNTDGIHLSTSSFVNITNSVIGTGDDCISIGQGTTNVSITGVTCGPGHGISIGSLGKYSNEKSVSGVVVRNCTLINTMNGARIKTWIGKNPGEVKSVTYEDIVMDGVKNPIIIDQRYGAKKKQEVSNSVWKINDVHFRNIRGTSATSIAVTLDCSSLNPCEGLELADINLTSNSPANSILSSSCSNAKPIVQGILNPPTCTLN